MAREMEIVFQTFSNMSEADEADRQRIRSLTGEERNRLALIMMAPYYEATPRLERIYPVVDQEELRISDGWEVAS